MSSVPARVALAAACLLIAVIAGSSIAAAQSDGRDTAVRANAGQPFDRFEVQRGRGGTAPKPKKPGKPVAQPPKAQTPGAPKPQQPDTPPSSKPRAPRAPAGPSRPKPRPSPPRRVAAPVAKRPAPVTQPTQVRPAPVAIRNAAPEQARPGRGAAPLGDRAKGRSRNRSAGAGPARGGNADGWSLLADGRTAPVGAPKRPRRAAKRVAQKEAAPPQPCPEGSCDVVTRLVAFVPGTVKLMVGLLGLLAGGFFVATVLSRRKLADARDRAATDALTGLPDHCTIHERLDEMVTDAQRANAPVAVVLIDLDNFKRINDSYGHLKGDDVLRAVSDKAREELRGPDFVGRYGGEEFLAILPDTEREGAVAVVDRLRRQFWEIEIAGVRELVTASMGVASYPVDGHTPNELIEAADDALYAAKASGRNQVRSATPVGQPAGPSARLQRPRAALPRPASVPARPAR